MNANESRARPGYVYGVAVHSSRQEEGTPSCPCPCHVADRPSGARGWYCDECHAGIVCCSYPEKPPADYSHEQAVADGIANPRKYMVSVPDYYYITKGNTLTDELGERFKTEAKAEARVKELNDADAIASLKVPRTHLERFDRYRELHGKHFGWWWYDGEHHPLTRFPRKPGKYAVETWHDGDTSWADYETLGEVRKELLSGDAVRVVDLDTGEDIPFTLSVSLELDRVPAQGAG